MGKEGLRLVILALNEEGVKNENARQAAEYYLENYLFIYQNPDDKTVRLSFISSFVPDQFDGKYLRRAKRGLF